MLKIYLKVHNKFNLEDPNTQEKKIETKLPIYASLYRSNIYFVIDRHTGN